MGAYKNTKERAKGEYGDGWEHATSGSENMRLGRSARENNDSMVENASMRENVNMKEREEGTAMGESTRQVGAKT